MRCSSEPPFPGIHDTSLGHYQGTVPIPTFGLRISGHTCILIYLAAFCTSQTVWQHKKSNLKYSIIKFGSQVEACTIRGQVENEGAKSLKVCLNRKFLTSALSYGCVAEVEVGTLKAMFKSDLSYRCLCQSWCQHCAMIPAMLCLHWSWCLGTCVVFSQVLLDLVQKSAKLV